MADRKEGLKLIDKKIVHKHKEENVFIYNLRRALPVYIEKDTVENIILTQLSEEEKDFFNQFYILHRPGDIDLPENSFWQEVGEREVYILFNIPHTLEGSFFDDLSNKIDESDVQELSKYYVKEEAHNRFVLRGDVGEIEEAAIFRILDHLNIHMPEEEKVRLSNILEKVEGLELQDTFFANMYVTPNHVFFFEHPNEHVPGMMVIEAVRQLGTATAHVYGKVPLKGSSFILSIINSSFQNYVELNYPVKLKIQLLNKKANRRGVWSYMDYEITVTQNDQVCGTFIIQANVIMKKLFARLRKDSAVSSGTHRFIPIQKFYHKISLWSEEKQAYINAQLLDISLTGFRLEFDIDKKMEGLSKTPFMICFEDVGFIKGECELLWYEEGDTRSYAGFKITEISKSDTENLKESIKRYCYIIENREII